MAKGKEISTLFVTIGLDDKAMVSGLNKAQKEIKAWSKNFLIAGAAITAALGYATKAALDEEVGINRLRNALKNAGADYDELSGQIEKNITATQASTNYSDGEQRDALTEIIGITGTYQGALEQLAIATDLAAAKDMDLNTAATLVGRAANGNFEILSRYGIEVKKGATATQVLAQMQERFAGAAKGAANPLTQLKNVTVDLVESVGALLVPALKSVVDRITPVINGFKAWIEEHPRLAQALAFTTGWLGLFLTGLGTLGMILPPISRGLTTVIKLLHLKAAAVKIVTAAQWLWNAALAANPIGMFITIMAVAAAGVYSLVKAFGWLTGGTKGAMNGTKELTGAEKEHARQVSEVTAKIQKLNDELADQQEELEKLQQKYGATDYALTGFADEVVELKHNLENTSYELGKAKDELDKIQTSYDDAAQKVGEFEQAISDANSELDELSNPRLEGMQEYEDKIFEVEQAIKKLELAQIQKGESKTRTKQIEDLQKQLEILELQRDIKFDPLTRQAKESVETVQGLNDELAPQTVFDRIAALGEQLGPDGELTTGLAAAKDEMAAQNDALTLQTEIVNGLAAAAEGYRGRLEEIDNIIENLNWELLLDLQDNITNTEAEIGEANQALNDLNLNKESSTLYPPTPGEKLTPPRVHNWYDMFKLPANLGDWFKLPSFADYEGPVPGALGQPMAAIIHGGEIISQPGSHGAGISQGSLDRMIAAAVERGLAGITVNVGGENVEAVISRKQYRKSEMRI
jgi:hypothetical protein